VIVEHRMTEDQQAMAFQRRIGANIRHWRTQRSLDIAEFAGRCQRPSAAIVRIESGEAMPSVEFLWRAAHVLNVSCLALTDQAEHRSAA
jgi:transcriptional regulator with XRE-family HTH domain